MKDQPSTVSNEQTMGHSQSTQTNNNKNRHSNICPGGNKNLAESTCARFGAANKRQAPRVTQTRHGAPLHGCEDLLNHTVSRHGQAGCVVWTLRFAGLSNRSPLHLLESTPCSRSASLETCTPSLSLQGRGKPIPAAVQVPNYPMHKYAYGIPRISELKEQIS